HPSSKRRGKVTTHTVLIRQHHRSQELQNQVGRELQSYLGHFWSLTAPTSPSSCRRSPVPWPPLMLSALSTVFAVPPGQRRIAVDLRTDDFCSQMQSSLLPLLMLGCYLRGSENEMKWPSTIVSEDGHLSCAPRKRTIPVGLSPRVSGGRIGSV